MPTLIQRPLSIEVWKPIGSVEWLLAIVWSYDVGRAALAVIAPLYPGREVTLRQDCRVIAKREPGPE